MTSHRRSHRRLVAGLAAVALLALAACSAATGAGTSAAAGTPTPQLPAAATLLSKAQQAALKDATFTLSLKVGVLAPEPGTGMLTTSPPRQESLVGDVPGHQAGHSTDFAGGGTYYVKPPEAADWFQASPSDIFANDPEPFWSFLEFADDGHLQAATVVGAETIGGVPTWHLRGTLPLTGNLQQALSGQASATEDLWLRQADAYPTKLVYHVRTGAGGDTTLTVTFTAWDSGLTLPIPPKPVPAGA